MLYTTTELSALKSDSTSSGYTNLIARAENILNTTPQSNFSNGIYTTATANYQNNLSDDCQNVFLLGIAYQISNNATQKPKYAQKAHSIITNFQEEMTSVATASYTNLSFYIPTLIFGTDLVKNHTGSPLSGATAFDNEDFKTWLTEVISPCSSKLNDSYAPNDNNVNTLWNMLDLAIAIYKNDSTGITNFTNYWKTLIDRQIISFTNNATPPLNIIPPLKDADIPTTTTPVPYTILPQEIDRCTPYKLNGNGADQFHSGATQGLRGIHYSNLALMAFIVTARLLKNKNTDVLFSATSVLTTHGQKLRDAIETTANFVLNPESSPYYRFLSSSGYTVSSFYNINETSYMRLSSKYFTIPNVSSILIDIDRVQIYDRYLFLPVLSKKWLFPEWTIVPNTH